MDQKKIRAFAGTALLAGVIAFMGTGAVQAQSVTPSEAAHHVIEQELQSHVPGQAVYAQNGVVIRSGIIRENYNKANTMEEKLTSRVDFAVSYHGERYLSFQTYGYDFVERAAHPTSWELGKTFDLETGKLVPWQKVLTPAVRGNFTLDKINKALWNTDYGKGHYFFQDFKGLEKLPENYYLDQEGHIHFVFGQYEIAPYAVGIIDLNMDQGV